MAWQRSSGSAEQDAPPSRLFLSASYLVLFVGGGLLGLYGALLLPLAAASPFSAPASGSTGNVALAAQHVSASGSGGGLGQLLSVGLLIAVVVNPLLSVAGLWTAGTRLAAFTPLAGWLIVVLVLSSKSGEGSNVLPSDLRSVAFLLLGALAFTAVGVLGRPTRGFTSIAGPLVGRQAGGPARPSGVKPAAQQTAPKPGKRR